MPSHGGYNSSAGGPAPDFIDIKWSDGPPGSHRMTETSIKSSVLTNIKSLYFEKT